MKNLTKIILAAAFAVVMSACEKESKLVSPIIGTWDFASCRIEAVADDPQKAAKIEAGFHAETPGAAYVPCRFREDGTWQNKFGLEGWKADCGGGIYSLDGQSLNVILEELSTGTLVQHPQSYRYAISPDGKTMTWEQDVLAESLALQSPSIHIGIVLPKTGESIMLDGVHSIKRIIALTRK